MVVFLSRMLYKYCGFRASLAGLLLWSVLGAQALEPVRLSVLKEVAPVSWLAVSTLPIVDIQVDILMGSAFESKPGVAALTKALLGRATQALDEAALAQRLDALGVELGVHLTPERLSLSLRMLSDPKLLSQATDLLIDLLQKPNFSEELFQRERSRMQISFQEGWTRPAIAARRFFDRLVYGKHPYASHLSVEDISALTLEDVQAFYWQSLRQDRIMISVVGDISARQVKNLAQRLLSPLPVQSTHSTQVPQVPAASKLDTRVLIPEENSLQAQVLIAKPIRLLRQDEAYMALLIANDIFGGGGFSSWLMQSLREEHGLVYGAHSSLRLGKVGGVFEISFQTKKESTKEAIQVVQRLLKRFIQQGPSQAAFKRAQQSLALGAPLSVDTNRKLLRRLASLSFYDLPLSRLSNFDTLIQDVSFEQMRQALKQYLSGRGWFTLVLA